MVANIGPKCDLLGLIWHECPAVHLALPVTAFILSLAARHLWLFADGFTVTDETASLGVNPLADPANLPDTTLGLGPRWSQWVVQCNLGHAVPLVWRKAPVASGVLARTVTNERVPSSELFVRCARTVTVKIQRKDRMSILFFLLRLSESS